MTNRHSSLEKYTSHFIQKGCERWVGDWTKTATYWSLALLAIAALLFHSAGLLNRGLLRTARPLLRAGSHCLELQQLTTKLQTHWTSCRSGLYHCLTSTCFSERRISTQFNPSTVKVIPWYLRPDAPVIYTGAFLIWQLGRVGRQCYTLCFPCVCISLYIVGWPYSWATRRLPFH